MSAVGATERTVGVHAAATTPPSETATATSLQAAPDPAAARLGGLELLFLLQSKDRQVGLDKGRQDVLTAKASRDIARKQEVEALNKAAEDGESGGFWSDVGKVCLTVAKVAAVVASVAVAVVSCGAAAPIAALAIAGAVLSTAGFVQSECHVLEKLGVEPQAAGWIGLGMSLAGAVCSGGVAAFGSAGAAGEGAQTAVLSIAKTTKTVTGVATAAALIGGGAATIVAENKKADAENDTANAMAAHNAMSRLQRAISMLIDDIRASDEADGRTLGHIRGAIEAKGAAMTAASMRV